MDPGDSTFLCRMLAENMVGRRLRVPDFVVKVLSELSNPHLPGYPPV